METETRITKHGPLVSVIIPTHNRPNLVTKAVASVVAQTYRPIEIIIIDDASDDPVSANWFKAEWKDISLSIHCNDISKGVAAARNSGINKSKGRYIAFLDDDDQWLPDKLAIQIDTLNRHGSPQVRGVFCQMIIEDEHGKEIGRTSFPPSAETIRQSMICGDGNVPPQTILVERDTFRTVGFFDEQMPSFEDRQWALRYLSLFEMILVDNYLVRYLEHPAPRLTINSDAMLSGELAYTKFIQNYLKTRGVSNKNNIGKAMGYRYSKLGNEYMLAGQIRAGLTSFLHAITLNPIEFRAWAGFIIGLGGVRFYGKIMAHRMLRVRLAKISGKKRN